MTRTHYDKSSYQEVIAASKLIEAHCMKDGDGHATWEDGWSDKKVADDLDISESSVSNIRRGLIGNLRTRTSGPNTSERLERLEQQTANLTDRITRLEKKLGIKVGRDLFFNE